MTDFLHQILKTTRQDLDERKKLLPLGELKAKAPARDPGLFHAAVTAPGISVIAEVKRASPSRGDIRPELDVTDIVRSYETGGARAISVLTEERYFKGGLADLQEARSCVTLPILRKDFIIDPYQVWEAAAAGADAVLLIVAALTPEELTILMNETAAAGLDPLVEVHTPKELEIALAAGAAIIGINNRDLATFEVSLQTTLDMIESIPDEVAVVSESGIRTREDVSSLETAGVDAVLIGESLMKSSNPAAKLKELLSS